ncbi:MAG: D-glycero-beta-D-manno-heptose 1-phosphate adenylyltransferase [Bacteroidota bacterium]
MYGSGWRVSGSKVVFTNGCFDLMHPGHLNYLAEARNLGQHLVIGLNTDESVQRLKGSHRPIMDEQARALLLASLAFVDLVVFFGEDTPLELIQMLRPDVLVKGADYKEEDVVGAKEVKSWGGTVALLPFVEGYSTSAIEAKIKSS